LNPETEFLGALTLVLISVAQKAPYFNHSEACTTSQANLQNKKKYGGLQQIEYKNVEVLYGELKSNPSKVNIFMFNITFCEYRVIHYKLPK
jgi:hypothetical protein